LGLNKVQLFARLLCCPTYLGLNQILEIANFGIRNFVMTIIVMTSFVITNFVITNYVVTKFANFVIMDP